MKGLWRYFNVVIFTVVERIINAFGRGEKTYFIFTKS